MKRMLSIVFALACFGAAIAPAAAATCSAQYTVKPGDNLFRIGVSFGIPWPQIAAANSLSNPSLIFPGQVLCIPPASGAPAPTPTATAAATATAVPTGAPTAVPLVVPTFSIVSVVKGTSVTIMTANFPSNQVFSVTMGPIGSQGIGGAAAGTTNSGAGGAFTATFSIPAQLAGNPQIAIRLQSASGYYAFNWFWNFTSP